MITDLTSKSRQKVVQITKEEELAIRQLLVYYRKKVSPDKPEEAFIKDFMSKQVRSTERHESLISRFSLGDMIQIVFNSQYEVISSEDDKILEYYSALNANTDLFSKAKAKGVVELLDVIGKKVYGVNR